MTQILAADGSTIRYRYDIAGRLTQKITASTSGTVTVALRYQGVRLAEIKDPAQTTVYDYNTAGRIAKEGEAEYKREWAKLPTHRQRVDLRPVVTPELLKTVRADGNNTQLKLTFTFNNDKLDVKAAAYKWR